MKLAIIGASIGQMPLCLKAKEMGVETICFAWDKGAVCKSVVDRFYPISIFEKEKILEICREERIDGVVSNASDLTAEIVSYISTEMNLHGVDYDKFISMRDKYHVREWTSHIDGLSQVRCRMYEEGMDVSFPCIVKPVRGASKQGVSLVADKRGLDRALAYSKDNSDEAVIVEDYVAGSEISVESISFEGKHYVIQITDKENSGAPHFVELSHHQPSGLDSRVKERINAVVPEILDAVGFGNGACHTEMIVSEKGELFLVEVNPRGGGDEISNTLVFLSTGYDYVKSMIDVALGSFETPVIPVHRFAGIYFLCKQRSNRLPAFCDQSSPDWLVRKEFNPDGQLSDATGNYDRNGFLIYCSDRKIDID